MSVEANAVYTLNKKTGAVIDICKLALERSQHNLIVAEALINKWCAYKTQSNLNSTSSSIVKSFYNRKTFTAAIAKITCSNLSFCKSESFGKLAQAIVEVYSEYNNILSLDAYLKQLQDQYECKIDTKLVSFKKPTNSSLLTTHNHKNSIVSMIEFEVNDPSVLDNKLLKTFAFDCAMHITVNSPLLISASHISAETKQELTVQIEKQLSSEGKELIHWNTAINGKIAKWAEQHSILSQSFIKDSSITVETAMKQISEKIGSVILINRFDRLSQSI